MVLEVLKREFKELVEAVKNSEYLTPDEAIDAIKVWNRLQKANGGRIDPEVVEKVVLAYINEGQNVRPEEVPSALRFFQLFKDYYANDRYAYLFEVSKKRSAIYYFTTEPDMAPDRIKELGELYTVKKKTKDGREIDTPLHYFRISLVKAL